MTEKFHKHLEKQIKKLGLSPTSPPVSQQKWEKFLKLVNKAYIKSDQNLRNSTTLTSALVSLEKELERQATHDPLTDLPNRILLSDRIQHAIAMEQRRHIPFGILFFDIDYFKRVNDSLGHQAGDALLKDVAKRLQNAFRREDTIARVGGDEFVMVVLDLKKEDSINNVAIKLLSLFKDPFKISGHSLFITISLGISLYPKDGKTPETLIHHGDIALYHAKDRGKNQFQFYSPFLKQDVPARLKK
jgi:diguanylate cyclase (GGDEF)-like protein